MRGRRILVTFGTRPEAIKMFPVVEALREYGEVETLVAVTAQHREMLDQVLKIAGLVPDLDLDIMQKEQSLDELTARILTAFGTALDKLRPDRVLVHGDTLTTMAASLACYFRKIPIGHVEAGLRSGDIFSPWPEEVNRKVTGVMADLHFAPTERAARALREENCDPASIHVTGNTVIDALFKTRERIAQRPELARTAHQIIADCGQRRIVLVTAHRRENIGKGMAEIAAALTELAERDDVAIVYPVHPNPLVAEPMRRKLDPIGNIHLVAPLQYPDFVKLMGEARIILSDSGGIQEEAPSLGKPVLVTRDVTERPEAIEAGTAVLVGANRANIVTQTSRLLDSESAYQAMASLKNPFGDGNAARRIAQILVAEQTRQ